MTVPVKLYIICETTSVFLSTKGIYPQFITQKMFWKNTGQGMTHHLRLSINTKANRGVTKTKKLAPKYPKFNIKLFTERTGRNLNKSGKKCSFKIKKLPIKEEINTKLKVISF